MIGRIAIFLSVAIGSLSAIVALGWLAEQAEVANAFQRAMQ